MSASVLLRGSYPATPESIPRVRDALAQLATSLGAANERTEEIALAVSEAATNVIVHAYNGQPGELHVTAACVDGALSIDVADDGLGLGRSPARNSLGFGFKLMNEYADQLAVLPRSSGGVHVKLRFDLQRPGRGVGSTSRKEGVWFSRSPNP